MPDFRQFRCSGSAKQTERAAFAVQRSAQRLSNKHSERLRLPAAEGEHFAPECKQIIEPHRVWRLIKEAKDELAATTEGRLRHDALPSSLRYRFYSEYFGLLKNSLIDPRDAPAQPFADFMLKAKSAEIFFHPGMNIEQKKLVIQAVHWMFKRYESVLQRERRMDFDDQKLRAVKCLQAAGLPPRCDTGA